MKKVKFEGKLNLNKERVTRLNDEQMENVNGGVLWSWFWCKTDSCPTKPETMPCATSLGGCTDPVSTSTCSTQ